MQKKNATSGALYKTYEIYASNGQLISEYTPSIGANAASSYITKTLTEHVYIGNKRLAETKRTTLHPPGSPVSNQYVNTYFHLDPAGTPLLASTPQGTLLWHESTRPYGSKRLNQPASAGNSVGYAGKPFDNVTGLSYMGARYYDPVLGRFMGIDPVGFQESNLHSHNRYTYANNNPYRFVDPDGRQAKESLGWLSRVAIAVTKIAVETAKTIYEQLAKDPSDDAGKTPSASATNTSAIGSTKTDKPNIGLRAGNDTINNYTPAIKDITGLSLKVPGYPTINSKNQIINLDLLPSFDVVHDYPGHISLVPKNIADMAGWIGTKGTGLVHPLSREIQNARIGEIDTSKPTKSEESVKD